MIQTLYGATALFGAGRRKWYPPFLAFVLSFAMPPVFAQEARKLSPDEAVDLAIKSNLSLESSRVTTGTKKRKVDTAWNVFIPTVTVGTALSAQNTAPVISGLAPVNGGLLPDGLYYVSPYSGDGPRWNLVLPSLSVSLNNLNIALFEGMKTVKLDYEGGLLSYEKAKVQLERDVRKAYYNMLLLEENIALLRENLAAAERRMSIAQTSYRAGLAPELNVLQAQVAMENMKPQIDQAENGLKLSMSQFAMQLGLPYDSQFELIPVESASDFIPLDVKELIASASNGKPDILELKQQILSLESQRKATFYQVFTPSLSISWNMNIAAWNNISGWGGWGDSWKNPGGGLTISLGFSLNGLLPFGAGQQGLKDIDDSLRSLQIGLAQAIQGTEIEIYSTILNLQKAQATIEAQSLTVDLAQRTYDLTEAAYRAGLRDLLEVQNAELELRKARLGILEQQFTYLQGLIDLEYAIGVPFGTLSRSVQ